MIKLIKTTGKTAGLARLSSQCNNVHRCAHPRGRAGFMELRISPDGVRPVIRDRDNDRDRRGLDRITFANERGCPEI